MGHPDKEIEREKLIKATRSKLEKLEALHSELRFDKYSYETAIGNLEKRVEENKTKLNQVSKELTKINIKLKCLESSDLEELSDLIGKCFRVKHTSFFRIRQVVPSEWKHDSPSFKIERLSYDAGQSNSSIKNENWKMNVLLDHISNSEEIAHRQYNFNRYVALSRLGLSSAERVIYSGQDARNKIQEFSDILDNKGDIPSSVGGYYEIAHSNIYVAFDTTTGELFTEDFDDINEAEKYAKGITARTIDGNNI